MKTSIRLASSSLATALLLLSTAAAVRAEVISVDFNNLSGTPPFALVGQTSDDALRPWAATNGSGLQVTAGDLTVEVPAWSKQGGTAQSASGSERAATTAALRSRWTTRQMGTNFWFSFLFRQPGPDARVGLTVNNSLRVVAVGSSLLVTSGEGKAITGLKLDKTHMVVGCIGIDTERYAPDKVQVWVDPADLNSLDSHKGKYSVFSANYFYDAGITHLGVESYSEPKCEGGTIDSIVIAPSLDEVKAALTGKAP
jgi:hypothetical protein